MSANRLEIGLCEFIITEKLIHYTIEIEANSNEGDGYMSDIIFLILKGECVNGVEKIFNIALKCSKESEMLRNNAPIKKFFTNEINVYRNILPALQLFQNERQNEVFDSFPKFYGSYIADNTEILILDNLKEKEYFLWDRKKPLSLEHIILVLKDYGKLHSISIAMQKQQPKRFEQLSKYFANIWTKIDTKMVETIKNCMKESYELIKDEVDIEIAEAWKKYVDTFENIFWNSKKSLDSSNIKAILHGDCWNNNFMFHYTDKNKLTPDKVALLDWQISEVASPIADISYFLFACLSQKDAQNIDNILSIYYSSLSTSLQALGCDPELLWSKQNFLKDWKQFGKVGLRFIPLITKAAFYDMDEVPSIIEGVNKGKGFISGFEKPIRNQTCFKERIKFIAELAHNNGII